MQINWHTTNNLKHIKENPVYMLILKQSVKDYLSDACMMD